MVPVHDRGRDHAYPVHHHYAHLLRQNDRDLPGHIGCADPHVHHDEPRVEPDGSELSQKPVCTGVSGLLNHRLRGNLCRPCAEHGRGERYLHGNLDGYGLHRAAVLHAVQDQLAGQERVQRTLTVCLTKLT